MIGENVITKCEIAITVIIRKYFRAIRKLPMVISSAANKKRQIFGGSKPRHNLHTVIQPISSAGLALGKSFKIPK